MVCDKCHRKVFRHPVPLLKRKEMRDSNFWYYTTAIIVIGHFLAGFVYLAVKLSSKKKKEDD